jgi:ketosteroid isomerase-like protein
MASANADTAAITALLHAYGAALSGGPKALPEVLSLYTSDGVLMAPHFEAAIGTEALAESYTRILGSIKLDIVFTICEIEVSGAWAFARTTAEGTKFWVQKGAQEKHWNQEIFVCRRVEGEWKIARYCFSSMKPLDS